jgi:hypothetical protein
MTAEEVSYGIGLEIESPRNLIVLTAFDAPQFAARRKPLGRLQVRHDKLNAGDRSKT